MQSTTTGPPDYRGEFETHITVVAPNQATLDGFQKWCQARGIKCVRIMLDRGSHVDQPMATWRQRNTVLSVVAEQAEECARAMAHAGFSVVRVKIEAALGNENIPLEDADARAQRQGNYFEHHVKLRRAAGAPRDTLARSCEALGAHLSRNAFREVADGFEERFVTLRSCQVGRFTSEKRLQDLLDALARLGEQVIDCESEYCVYDSNLDVDAGWLCQQA